MEEKPPQQKPNGIVPSGTNRLNLFDLGADRDALRRAHSGYKIRGSAVYMDESQPFDHFGDPKGLQKRRFERSKRRFCAFPGSILRPIFDAQIYTIALSGWLGLRECHTIKKECF